MSSSIILSRLVNPVSCWQAVCNTNYTILLHTTSELLKESKQHWNLCSLSNITQWMTEGQWHSFIWKRVWTNSIELIIGCEWHFLSVCLQTLYCVSKPQTVTTVPRSYVSRSTLRTCPSFFYDVLNLLWSSSFNTCLRLSHVSDFTCLRLSHVYDFHMLTVFTCFSFTYFVRLPCTIKVSCKRR